jgi:hypothetical protein
MFFFRIKRGRKCGWQLAGEYKACAVHLSRRKKAIINQYIVIMFRALAILRRTG